MGSSTGVRHETRSEQHSPRVGGSTPVRGKFFAEFFSALIQFWHRCQNDLFTEKLVCLTNSQLTQKVEYCTLNQWFMRGLGSTLTGGNILSLDFFLFSCSKAPDASVVCL